MDAGIDGTGLFGVAGHSEASALVLRALADLPHRAAGAVGVAACDGHQVRLRKALGGPMVGRWTALTGGMAVGQVWGREAETDEDLLVRGGPVRARTSAGRLAVAVAGRFANSGELAHELRQRGAAFHTGSSSELFLHLIATSAKQTLVNRVVDALWRLEGAYCLAVLAEDKLILARDPRGFRPLVLGQVGAAVVFATDEGAIEGVGGDVRRELAPGEMVIVDGRRVMSVSPLQPAEPAPCALELLSLASWQSTAFGLPVAPFRRQVGVHLAAHHGCSSELVVPMEPTDEVLAEGYGAEAGIPLVRAVERSPTGTPRVARALVAGRAVALVTTTLMTGHSIREVAQSLRAAGAAAIHVRAGAPSLRTECRFGVDTPTTDELLSTVASKQVEIASKLGVDSFAAPAVEELLHLLGRSACAACMGGKAPIELAVAPDDQLALFE